MIISNKIALRPALLMCLMILVAQHAGAVTIDGFDVRVVAGGGDGPDGSPALEAKLVVPFGVQLDRAGNLYIAEFNGGRIRKVDTKGVLTTIAGTGKKGYGGDGGPATKAQFSGIYCNAINPSMDKIYVADLNNKRIRVIDLKTGIADTVAGSGKRGVPKDGAIAKNSPLVDPRAVAADRHGNVYVLERGGHALRVITPDGKIRTLVGTGKKGAKNGPGRQASLNGPKHLCIDLDDNVIIADAENRLIRKYDVKTGQISTLLSAAPGQKKGDKPIRLGRPHGVYVHTDGTLYIADSYNGRILGARKIRKP